MCRLLPTLTISVPIAGCYGNAFTDITNNQPQRYTKCVTQAIGRKRRQTYISRPIDLAYTDRHIQTGRQINHQMANVNNLQKTHAHFCASSYRQRYIQIIYFLFQQSTLWSQSSIFAMTPFDIKICKCLPHVFALALTVSKIFKF